MIVPDTYPSGRSFVDSQGPLFLAAGVSPCDHDLQHDLDISHLPLPPHRTSTLVMKRHSPAARWLGMRRAACLHLFWQPSAADGFQESVPIFVSTSTGDIGKDHSAEVLGS